MKTRILAIDHGRVRLGLAISDPDHKIASPLANYERKNAKADIDYLRKIIEEEEVGVIVVGLPLHLSGDESEQSTAARKFGEKIQQELGIPCVFWDERFSTRFAESALWESGLTHTKRKQRRDKVAAQMFLQAFLEAGCPGVGIEN